MFKRTDDFNIILATDGYKVTHWKQYPHFTENVYSYLESRGGKFDSTIFFGLQYYLKRYLEGQVVTQEKIDEAERRLIPYIGDHFNRKGWEYILHEHGGRLPVSIKAVPEGTDVPTHNVLMTIENTDPKCFWLTNYLETMLVEVWYPTTVATLSNRIRRMLLGYLEKTGTPSLVDFMFHDFGYRGVSSQESAALGGASHLVNFKGTDTIAGMELLREYYEPSESPGFSIPASEHSTITAWGEKSEEYAFRNMLHSYPKGPMACVSDSYNIWNACSELWGKTLRMEVMNRDGTLIVRPDSGDPPLVDCKCLDLLGKSYGARTNDKGYRVLHPKVRLIQGDGVDYEETIRVLDALLHDEWSADNIAFGCGGALLQKVDRDTQKFAFKCSSIRANGNERDVYKDPVTDVGKKSKRGRLLLDRMSDGRFVTIREGKDKPHGPDQLVEVFLNGKVTKVYTLDDIRERATS